MPPDETPGVQRLQKVLAAAGIGSRRACEELIERGRVVVDGRRARLGDKVDPSTATIQVNGERVVTDTRMVYLAMNKPRGVVSTMADEKGRAALADFLGRVQERVYHVGRLDADSEGLLLLTNDGTLAHRLMHPSYGVPKTYLCEVAGPLPRNVGRRLMAGVELDDGPATVDSFRVIDTLGRTVQVELTLHEGRKHIVRRLLAEVGHPVSRLVRTAIGPIRLGDLRPGRTRRLTNAEIAALFRAVEDVPAVENGERAEKDQPAGRVEGERTGRAGQRTARRAASRKSRAEPAAGRTDRHGMIDRKRGPHGTGSDSAGGRRTGEQERPYRVRRSGD